MEPRDASAILQVLRQSEASLGDRVRMGQRGRRVAERFSADTYARRLVELYRDVLGRECGEESTSVSRESNAGG